MKKYTLLFLFGFSFVFIISPQIVYVENYRDKGSGTLRDAIEKSNKNTNLTTVYFQENNKTISLKSDLPLIEKPIIINGIDQYITIDCADFNGFILEKNSDGSAIKGIRIINSKEDGITLNNSGNHQIIHNRIERSTNGIHVSKSHDNTINNNIINNNRNDGIHLFCSNNNRIYQNMIIQNSFGLLLDSSDSNIVNNNNIIDNKDYDIFLASTSSHKELTENIYTRENHNIVVSDNHIEGNLIGINLLTASDNYINSNMLLNNTKGIVLKGNSYHNRMEKNSIKKSNIGINIDSFSSYNQLYENKFSDTENSVINHSKKIYPFISNLNAKYDDKTLIIEGLCKGAPNTEYIIQFFEKNKKAAQAIDTNKTFIHQIDLKTDQDGKAIIYEKIQKKIIGNSVCALFIALNEGIITLYDKITI